ncbi:MAG: hypothetical protein MUO40_00765, partial [Anaerolineaceae bacterium]|nr:hypothetical protein [Anaerolineaceae bacterium]
MKPSQSSRSKAKPEKTLFKRLRDQIKEFWSALRNTPEAFRLVWKTSKTAALMGIGLTLVAAVLPAAQAW